MALERTGLPVSTPGGRRNEPLHVSDCIAELIRDLERRVQEGA